ncbi:methyltransferase family protein [Haloactinospora alba]|uniref:Methyltransferase family protein n=1 Tax=Haloactinospora alba TaxID=405555 RepID=A0A543NEQ8_9ACTN|nr:class I SAM-dependent methyltransferase [Haloactinospora alba]TQN30296.1 methyltransferase family protein [Haloactinospora alba]
MSETITGTDSVPESYEYLSTLIEHLTGLDMHFGFWSGAEDDASIEQATARLTDIVIDRLGVGPGDRVLDVGCGNGGPAVRIAETTGAEVVAVDVNEAALRRGESRSAASGTEALVTFTHTDALSLPHDDDTFGAVLAFESTPHFELDPLFGELSRVLRPGGALVIETPCLPPQFPEPDSPSVRRYLDLLQARKLHTVDELTAAVSGAGLETRSATDITGHTNRSFHELTDRLREHSQQLHDTYGSSGLDELVEIFGHWADLNIGGHIIEARKPATTTVAR